MARLPARSGGRNVPLIDPSREFGDIYDRMGQLVNVALGDLGAAWFAELPWSPSAKASETENAYVVAVMLPGVHKDQISLERQHHRRGHRPSQGQAAPQLSPVPKSEASRPREFEVSDN
jgi:hypothetical protein